MVLEQQFMSMVNKAANQNTPVKVTMKRDIPTWSQFEQKLISREAFVRFMNNKYVAYMDERENEKETQS